MTDLKPCPFCGNPPARLVSLDGKKYISCLNYKCPCQPETAAYKAKGAAARAWNRRADNVAPVVHTRWAHLGGDEWCCPVCGFVITTEGSWDKPTKKYCEDCGAKMDGEPCTPSK